MTSELLYLPLRPLRKPLRPLRKKKDLPQSFFS